MVATSLNRFSTTSILRPGAPRNGYEWMADFLTNQTQQGLLLSRAGSGVVQQASGDYAVMPADAARLEWNPSVVANRGVLLEGSRTNAIRNSAMQGAAIGMAPTNWTASGLTTSGILREVVGTGTWNGLPYLDIRFRGTSTAATGVSQSMDTTTAIAAVNAQAWTYSGWYSVIAGSTANFTTIRSYLSQRDAAGAFISNVSGTNRVATLTSTPQRFTDTITTNSASTNYILPAWELVFNSGVAVDITLRIAAPQLEQAAFASSYIATSGTVATRAGEHLVMDAEALGLFPNQGTALVAEFMLPALPSSGMAMLVQLDNGTDTAATRISLDVSSGGTVALRGAASSAAGGVYTVGSIATVTAGWKNGKLCCRLNAGSVVEVVGTTATNFTRLRLGNNVAGTAPLFGYLRKVALRTWEDGITF